MVMKLKFLTNGNEIKNFLLTVIKSKLLNNSYQINPLIMAIKLKSLIMVIKILLIMTMILKSLGIAIKLESLNNGNQIKTP